MNTGWSAVVPALQVDYVEPSQNTISLKMIPRIDLDRIKAKMSLVGPAHAVAVCMPGGLVLMDGRVRLHRDSERFWTSL